MITDQKNLFDLVQQQKMQLTHYFEQLDLSTAERIIERLAACQGTLYLTGIGKSGMVATKIAHTLASFGIKAHDLSPLDALHGDLGLITAGDLLIIISKSGEGKEFSELLRITTRKGADAMLWTSNREAPLADSVSLTMFLPPVEELCPFGKAPTLSVASQLLFGDLVTIGLAQKKQPSLNEYANNHPAGKIGRDIVRVSERMLQGEKIPTAYPSMTLSEVLPELSKKRCGCVLILEGKKVVGLFTDGDLRRALEAHPPQLLFQMAISHLMTRNFFSIAPTALVQDALRIMQDNGQRRVLVLPVIEEQELVGLINLHDLY